MNKTSWQSANDLITLFSSRPIAVPLIILLIAKIYSLSPAALGYIIGLTLLTAIFSMRWGLHYVATHRQAFAAIYREEQKKK